MHSSVADLEARVRRVPELLGQALCAPLPAGLRPLRERRVVLTGIGVSEAVARSLEVYLRHDLQLRAIELPMSAFISDDVAVKGQTLVLLSQELCPNATLALARAHEFEQALLLTSLPEGDERLRDFRKRGGLVWTLPPEQERDLLVRVEGPACAALALVRLGLEGSGQALPTALLRLPEAMRSAQAAGFSLAESWPLKIRRPPFLATGHYAQCLELLAWTWMEAWWTEPPPVFDVLQLAHGPWQQRFEEAGPWLCFTRFDESPMLWSRLERMLPERQWLVRVPATVPGPLALFEHLGFVQGLLAGGLRRAPVNLTQWPGKDSDAPLYQLKADDFVGRSE